jgi:DNA-binding protein H-NS
MLPLIDWRFNMSDYKSLLEQKRQLEAQIEAARRGELNQVVTEILAKMREFNVTIDDLQTASKPSRPPVLPKYRDTVTGATWTGRGKPPRWFDRTQIEKFLIA